MRAHRILPYVALALNPVAFVWPLPPPRPGRWSPEVLSGILLGIPSSLWGLLGGAVWGSEGGLEGHL
eukprot:2732305-Pyramimonas_sp.AAC.1